MNFRLALRVVETNPEGLWSHGRDDGRPAHGNPPGLKPGRAEETGGWRCPGSGCFGTGDGLEPFGKCVAQSFFGGPDIDLVTDEQGVSGWSGVDVEGPSGFEGEDHGEHFAECGAVPAFEELAGSFDDLAMFAEVCAELVEPHEVVGVDGAGGDDFDEFGAVLGEHVGEIGGEPGPLDGTGRQVVFSGNGHAAIERLVSHSLSGEPFFDLGGFEVFHVSRLSGWSSSDARNAARAENAQPVSEHWACHREIAGKIRG